MTLRELNMRQKTSCTDTHFFFLNGPCSQWHPATFRATPIGTNDELEFNCAEQFMMASKAALFGDWETFKLIMEVEQRNDWRKAPKRQKELGRDVTPFDEATWLDHAPDIVKTGNLAKFSQNDDLKLYLLSTSPKILVEGASYDPLWGVGLAWDNPLIADPKNWRGKNWLGDALTWTREQLACSETSTTL